VLITDSGSGLTKAGWGGLCRYDPDKCATAKQPSISKLEIKVIGNGDSNAGGKVGEIWVGQNEPLAFISDDAAQNCSRDYTWNFGDGGNSKARNPFYSFSSSGEFNVTLKLKCKGDECVNETERSTNRVVNVCDKVDATGASISFIQVPAGSRVKSKLVTDKHFAVTGMEKVEIVDIGISCEENYWFPYVKSIRGEAAIYQPTSHGQGVALINSANQSNSYDYCAQVSNLTQVPLNDSKYSGPYWSSQPAIDVHEMHHLNGFRSRFDASYVREINSDWKIKFRELTSQISKQGAYTKFFEQVKTARAWETSFEVYSDSQGGNLEDALGFGSAYRSEKPVTAPLAEAICKRAKLEGWVDIKSCVACK
jgi:PKD domain